MNERIQKIIARAGLMSRRKAEDAIREGRVTVNGRLASLGDTADPREDALKVDGKRVPPPSDRNHYYLVHKPKGVLCTSSDPEGRPTIMDILPKGLQRGIVPVGRLDFQTEGLILLTDDGDLAQKVAHPRYGSSKTYHVKVSGRPSEKQVDRLRRGVVLEGRRTRPAVIEYMKATEGRNPNSWWKVILKEGRTRQIRDMFYRIGHPVSKLRRVAIGALEDRHLPRGQFRELRPREIALLRRDAGKVSKRRPSSDAGAEGEGKKRRTPRTRPVRGGSNPKSKGPRGGRSSASSKRSAPAPRKSNSRPSGTSPRGGKRGGPSRSGRGRR